MTSFPTLHLKTKIPTTNCKTMPPITGRHFIRDGFAEHRKQINKNAAVPINERSRILLSAESIINHTKKPTTIARKKQLKSF